MKKIIAIFVFLFCVPIVSTTEINWDNYYWEKAIITPNNLSNSFWLEFYFLPNNPKYGYAVGVYGDVYNGRGVFAKTSDSGRTWSASFIDPNPQGRFHAESVIFIDTNTGYCSGNIYLYKTTNGGTTWTRVGITSGSTIMPFSGSWGCWAIGNNVWIAEGSCYTQRQIMHRSNDGGNNWLSYTIYNTDNHITDIRMFNENSGYAIGSGAIFMTSNGGVTWTKLCNTGQVQWTGTPAGTTNINWHEDIQIHNRSILIPASGGCQGWEAGNNQGAALFSSDFGESWNVFKTKGSTFGTWLNNDSCGWVCGRNKEVYYTKNYGKNWTLMNCGIEGNNDMDDLWFINDSIGFVCGDGGIYRLEKKDDNISITGDSTICGKNYAILNADGSFKKYEWFQITSQGDTVPINKNGKDAVIENAGTYIVKGIHDADCYYIFSDPFSITTGARKPDIRMDVICYGDTIAFYFDNYIGYPDSLLKKIIIEPEVDFGSFAIVERTDYNVKSIKYVNYLDTIKRVCFAYGEDDYCIDTLCFDIVFEERIKPILKIDGVTTFCDNVDRTLFLENAELFTDNIWYLDDNQIAENVSSYKPTKSGTYKVVASNNGNCIDSSDTISITITEEKDALEITEIVRCVHFDDTCSCMDVRYGQQICGTNLPAVPISHNDKLGYFRIQNKSDKAFILNANDITFRYKTAFTAPLSQFPIIIQPNEYAEILLCFSPTKLGENVDTLYIKDYCSTISIPLLGNGLRNEDTSDAPCNVTIMIATRSIEQKYIIELGSPIPNPVESKGKISYKIMLEKNKNIENAAANIADNFGFQLYNVVGLPIDVAYTIESISNEIFDNKEIKNGQISFDMKNLPIGAYFIRISYGDASKIFSVIKN